MQKWLWLLASCLVVAGLLLSFKYGMGPKPIPQINSSAFEEPEQIGAVAYRRLRQVIRESGVIILGSSPFLQNSDRIWTGFIRTAQADGVKFLGLVEQEGLNPILKISPLFGKFKAVDLRQSTEIEALNEAKPMAPLILHLASASSAHLVNPDELLAFRGQVSSPVTAISLTSYVVARDQLEQVLPPCPEGATQPAGQEWVSCAAVRVSKKFFRKNISKEKLSAVMEQVGQRDYLLYVHEPREKN